MLLDQRTNPSISFSHTNQLFSISVNVMIDCFQTGVNGGLLYSVVYVLFTGHGDLCTHGGRAGCVNLLLTIQQRVRPAYHVFGHIHEGKQLALLV